MVNKTQKDLVRSDTHNTQCAQILQSCNDPVMSVITPSYASSASLDELLLGHGGLVIRAYIIYIIIIYNV